MITYIKDVRTLEFLIRKLEETKHCDGIDNTLSPIFTSHNYICVLCGHTMEDHVNECPKCYYKLIKV